jgi:hypothetical protein
MHAPTATCILVLCLALSGQAHQERGCILERDIDALTFTNGKYTLTRRTMPRLQMTCIGEACSGNRADTMHCVNAGTDGSQIQWNCEVPDIDKSLSIGETIIQCEGYDHPGDRYVSAGSCFVTYRLHGPVPPPSARQERNKEWDAGIGWAGGPGECGWPGCPDTHVPASNPPSPPSPRCIQCPPGPMGMPGAPGAPGAPGRPGSDHALSPLNQTLVTLACLSVILTMIMFASMAITRIVRRGTSGDDAADDDDEDLDAAVRE